MKIHIIRNPATEKEIQEMLEELETYIKLAVDVERNILAGGHLGRGLVPCDPGGEIRSPDQHSSSSG